eukprot:gene13852-9902_t
MSLKGETEKAAENKPSSKIMGFAHCVTEADEDAAASAAAATLLEEFPEHFVPVLLSPEAVAKGLEAPDAITDTDGGRAVSVRLAEEVV